MKLKLYILIAPQCSGKSTWVKNNLSKLNNPHISSMDAIRISLNPDMSYKEAWKNSNEKEVKRIMREELKLAITDKRDIIIDNMNLRVNRRKEFLCSVGKDYEKIAIVFSWDKETFIKRNAERIIKENKEISLGVWEESCSQYQKPTKEEGFDKIIFLK